MWDKGDDSFKADPPNATLSELKKEGSQNVVVELMSVEMKKGSLTFNAKAHDGERAVPGTFGDASIFIDVTTWIPY